MDFDFKRLLAEVFWSLFISCIYDIISDILSNKRRAKAAFQQGEQYHRNLTLESIAMENKELDSQREIAETISQLEQENDELTSQIEELRNESDGWDSNSSIRGDSSNGDVCETIEDQLFHELEEYKTKEEQLETAEKEIIEVSDSLASLDVDAELIQQAKDKSLDLKSRIKQLTDENDELKRQIESCNELNLTTVKAKLDPDLVQFMEDHSEELTLSFLQKAYDTLLELRATNPNIDFNQYIRELKEGREKYLKDWKDSLVSKREVEIKLKKAKKRYEEELVSFNETKIEHFLKHSGHKEYLDSLRKKNQKVEEMIGILEKELASKTKEVESWREKYKEAEEQCNRYYKAYEDIQLQKEQLEAQRKALEQEKRMLFKTNQMSSASSLVDGASVPPPPDIDVPSIDEILRSPLMDMQ